MKEFLRIKTVQLIIEIVLAITFLVPILSDSETYHLIASNPDVKFVCGGIWAVFAVSFIFLFYDFYMYAGLKRKYGEIDMAMYSDPLTGIGNRSSCDAFIEEYVEQELPSGVACITFDLYNIGKINQEYGAKQGNMIIKEFSSILAAASMNKCFVGRNGGNKFLAIFKNTTCEDMNTFIEDVYQRVDARNKSLSKAKIEIHHGKVINEHGEHPNINEMVSLSYKKAVAKHTEDLKEETPNEKA